MISFSSVPRLSARYFWPFRLALDVPLGTIPLQGAVITCETSNQRDISARVGERPRTAQISSPPGGSPFPLPNRCGETVARNPVDLARFARVLSSNKAPASASVSICLSQQMRLLLSNSKRILLVKPQSSALLRRGTSFAHAPVVGPPYRFRVYSQSEFVQVIISLGIPILKIEVLCCFLLTPLTVSCKSFLPVFLPLLCIIKAAAAVKRYTCCNCLTTETVPGASNTLVILIRKPGPVLLVNCSILSNDIQHR